MADRNGKFKFVNNLFYKYMNEEENISRFKIFISELLKDQKIKEEAMEEITELKTRKI